MSELPGNNSGEILYWDGRMVRPLDVSTYPDGMPLVRFDGGPVERMLLRPITMSGFLAGLFFAQAIGERGWKVPHLILPFVPGARQDRINDTGDYLFSAKSVAKMINACNFPTVTVLDPHSEVTPALIDRCRVAHVDRSFLKGTKWDAVVSPDAGAEKRALRIAKALDVPLIHAWKLRDEATGRITGFGIEHRHHFHALIVDDICDGGATFVGLRDAMNREATTADLFVTHGLFRGDPEPLRKRFGRIITTDSFAMLPPHGVEVLPVCQRLLEGGVPE